MNPIHFRSPITLTTEELRQAINLGELNLHGQLTPLAHRQLAQRVWLCKQELDQRDGE